MLEYWNVGKKLEKKDWSLFHPSTIPSKQLEMWNDEIMG
jgi:hypothetical protein